MAISFVGAADYVGSSGALPTFAAGDIALVFAYRDGNVTSPSLPSGWSDVPSGASGANSNSARTGYRILQAGDTSTGTWTNATEIQVIVLRGQHASPLGANDTSSAANNNQIVLPGIVFVSSGSPQGASWVVGFAGHRTATDVNAKAVSGMTTRSGDVTSLGLHTAENVTTSFPTSNYTTTVNASSAWRSFMVEIRSAASTTATGTAQISLAPSGVPATRTGHAIQVRARVQVANGETIRAALYDGATNITDTAPGYLESAVLTTSLTSYSLAIADADAAAISSYSNLEIRVWGYSSLGNAATFEIAELGLSIPPSTGGTGYGATVMPLTLGVTTNGSVVSAGSKTTGVARISLAGGVTPATRTNHVISVRARRTSLQGKIRAQLFEGSSPRSAILETGELTTSLADYSLAIADADAATIGSYADLELRLWGYSSTGTATPFEIASASMSLPNSATGGAPTGQVVIASTTSVTIGGSSEVYPSTSLYPYPMLTFGIIGDVAIAGAHTGLGQVVRPLTLTVYTAGNTSTNPREGSVTFASTVNFSLAPAAPARFGQLAVGILADVSVSATGINQTGQLAINSTAAVIVSGSTPAVPPPPDFVTLFPDMPAILVGIAFASQPFDSFQNYSGVTLLTRALSTSNGRQFELDRFEAGNANLVLSNNDSRFNPENTSSVYYPNVEPTHRLRWQAYWNNVTYNLFHGFLEGYPQEFPSQGIDALVRQHSTDYTMALALSKFTPGSTTLAQDLAANDTDWEGVWIAASNTGLPMPQAVPFTIRIDDEEVTVTEIPVPGTYTISRTAGGVAHSPGAPITTTAISFASELSGTRVKHILDRIGVPTTDYAVDAGQTLLAQSQDLAGSSPIEHLTFVAEVEGGRLFISNAGKVTFHERHRPLKTEITSRATFGDAGGSELPYYDLEVTHDQEHIYNIVRVTSASGYVAEARDQASINQHFERVLEKQWPLANDNDADAAVRFLLAHYSSMQLRVPSLVLYGRASPSAMWPHLLGMEIGQRFRVIRRVPGTDIDKELLVEGVERSQTQDNLETKVKLSLAETRHYWRVGITGYCELGTNTRVAY